MELKKKRTEEAKQRLVVYQLYETKRKQEQTELLKKRRKAARNGWQGKRWQRLFRRGLEIRTKVRKKVRTEERLKVRPEES